MKIIRSIQVSEEKEIDVRVNHKNKVFTLNVTLRDGKVVGDAYHSVGTAYLAYFDTPLAERERHFKAIKKYVENKYK